MTFDEYQTKAASTNLTPPETADTKILSISFMDKVLGLVGESGEVADKVKKLLRDKNGQFDDSDREELVKELGDTLWYIATLAPMLGVSMDEVARRNAEKLSKRKQQNKLAGSGDNR